MRLHPHSLSRGRVLLGAPPLNLCYKPYEFTPHFLPDEWRPCLKRSSTAQQQKNCKYTEPRSRRDAQEINISAADFGIRKSSPFLTLHLRLLPVAASLRQPYQRYCVGIDELPCCAHFLYAYMHGRLWCDPAYVTSCHVTCHQRLIYASLVATPPEVATDLIQLRKPAKIYSAETPRDKLVSYKNAVASFNTVGPLRRRLWTFW